MTVNRGVYADGKAIIGHGGGDTGERGYASTYDTNTGELLWRFWIVPGNPADGFESEAMEMASKTRDGEYWKYGHGGTASNDITFDPELNRVCIGTGNSGPYHPEIRSPDRTGDNLFLCSIVALDADTGDYIWHYQVNPREVWDFKAIMDIILADLEIGGRAQGADLSHFTIYIGKLGLRMLQRGVPGCQLFVLLLFGRGWLAPLMFA